MEHLFKITFVKDTELKDGAVAVPIFVSPEEGWVVCVNTSKLKIGDLVHIILHEVQHALLSSGIKTREQYQAEFNSEENV